MKEAVCVGCVAMARAPERLPFGPRDLLWAAVLAAQAGLALENAEQIEKLLQTVESTSKALEAANKAREAPSRSERIIIEKLPQNVTLPSAAPLAPVTAANNEEEPARQMGQVSLSRVAQAAVEIMRPTTKHACIVGVTGAADDVVQGDARLLTYMVVNLMVDALHAMPKSNGTIDIRVMPGPDEVAVEVRDNASPAASAERVRVLSALAGQPATVTGMRLSLTISADVLRRHGGRLEVDAAPDDQGTVVTVWIPRRPTAKKSEARVKQAPKTGSTRFTTLRMPDEPRKKRFTTGK
jgi:signal transduction histidine kinase